MWIGQEEFLSHYISFPYCVFQTSCWRPNIIKNVLIWMFICSFCPLENNLLMLPTCSGSVLWREAPLSKWQTSHGLWHGKWMYFCFWTVCPEDKDFLWCLQLFARTAGQWKAKSSFQSLAVYSVSCLFSFDIQERTDILEVPKKHRFFFAHVNPDFL